VTHTNIKGLPTDCEYVTLSTGSDRQPYKVVRKTRCTMDIAQVYTCKHDAWSPSFQVGGFSAHCTNQSEQTWLYTGLATSTLRVHKPRTGWEAHRTLTLNTAVRFYDYNF
tara:strand:- start:70 stop:399 length:330 start_codon:yes stop_codon:yes gene_type:complete